MPKPRARAAPPFLVLLLLMGAAGVRAQSLQDELSGLVTEHPDILGRESATEAARQGITRARATLFPRVDTTSGAGPQYIDSPLARSQGGGAWYSTAQTAGIRVTQTMFDGFATPATIKTAKLNLEIAQFTLAGTRQNVLFDGIAAYVEVLRQKRLVELARESERTIMRQLHLEDERVQRGAGIAVDVLQAKARLQLAKERRVAYEGGLADAVARYTQVFNHPPPLDRMSEPRPPVNLLPPSLDDAIAIAQEYNPAIDSSMASVAVAGQKRRLAKADYYPKVDLVGVANHENNNNLVRGTAVDFSMMVQATWNLFNGFATSAGSAQAAAEYQASRHAHEMIARKVTEASRLAWNDLSTARQRAQLLKNAVDIAAEVFDARRKLRETGLETVINVLDAENELYNARITLVAAQGDEMIATYRMLQAIGRLDVEDLKLATDDARK